MRRNRPANDVYTVPADVVLLPDGVPDEVFDFLLFLTFVVGVVAFTPLGVGLPPPLAAAPRLPEAFFKFGSELELRIDMHGPPPVIDDTDRRRRRGCLRALGRSEVSRCRKEGSSSSPLGFACVVMGYGEEEVWL